MALFHSQGILRYAQKDGGHYRLAVDIDSEITRYYRSLIPKYVEFQPQAYPGHISVVRKEIPLNLAAWGKYEGQPLDFVYENVIRIGSVYLWLNCFSKRLEEIRLELGLPVDSIYTLPPEGFAKCFHITLGNRKHLITEKA